MLEGEKLPESPFFPYAPAGANSLTLAVLSRRDHERARACPGFSIDRSYYDYLAARDALLLSYAIAGVTAALQRVPFECFERWARLTGSPPTLDGLDEFAAHWRWRAAHPKAPTLGRFGGPGDPERYGVEAGGAQCVVVRPEVFVRWRDDYARSGVLPPPDLDRYAAHIVECCLSRGRASRPAVRSA